MDSAPLPVPVSGGHAGRPPGSLEAPAEPSRRRRGGGSRRWPGGRRSAGWPAMRRPNPRRPTGGAGRCRPSRAGSATQARRRGRGSGPGRRRRARSAPSRSRSTTRAQLATAMTMALRTPILRNSAGPVATGTRTVVSSSPGPESGPLRSGEEVGHGHRPAARGDASSTVAPSATSTGSVSPRASRSRGCRRSCRCCGSAGCRRSGPPGPAPAAGPGSGPSEVGVGPVAAGPRPARRRPSTSRQPCSSRSAGGTARPRVVGARS